MFEESFKVCSDGHQEIHWQGRRGECPLCFAFKTHDKILAKQDELLTMARGTIESLREKLAETVKCQ